MNKRIHCKAMAVGSLNNIIPRKIFKGMIELYLSKVTETSESEQASKYYARVSYKQTMGDSATVASPRVAKPRWSLAVVRGIICLCG